MQTMTLKATAPRTLWRLLSCLAVCNFASAAQAQAAGPDQGFFLDLAALESSRVEKDVCQEKHPEFSEKNAVAFAASPYSKKTAEELIGALDSADDRRKLLAHLPQLRAEIRAGYAERSPPQLKSVCASYASAIEQMTRDAQARGKKP